MMNLRSLRILSGALCGVPLILVLAVVAGGLVTAPVADAALAKCGGACARKQKKCALVARGDHQRAKAVCDRGAPGLECRRGARDVFLAGKRACRTATRDHCKPCCRSGGVGGINACSMAEGRFLAAEPQEVGDPVVGRDNLLNGDFMTCGIPQKIWDLGGPVQELVARGYGGHADAPNLPGRTGRNATMPYFLNSFTAANGAVVLNANCLMCHGGFFDGELVLGLANANADFTAGAGGGTGPVPESVIDALGLTPAERHHWDTISSRGAILADDTRMRTVGSNPAEILAVLLMTHRDRDTLTWSDVPYIEVVPRDEAGDPIPDALLTSDPAPWWRVHKKNALFYNGMARGDHRGTMALATSVCVEDVARAGEVDALFRDIQAFINTVRPPAYPRSIDAALASEGEGVFLENCAICHGTYDANESNETYPNLLIPLDVIGTDPAVANAGVVHSPELVDWYNASYYGQVTRMEPNDPFPGYMPPPLDGIWATAPFLHNGSVPTVELLLNSAARPRYWKRVDYDTTNFDEEALGWPWISVDTPQAEAPEEERKFIYDTTYWSQSNRGHTFGDHLTAAERRAVIEYLKTF